MGKVIDHEPEHEHDYENKLEDLLWAMRMRVGEEILHGASRASKIGDALAP